MVNNKKQSHHVRHAVVGTLSALGLMALTTQAASASKVTVKSGDTVWGIAQKHGLTVKAVEDANSSIKKLDNNIDLIYAGQTLEVPDGQDNSASSASTTAAATTVAAPASQASNGSAYTVQAGDTLSQLAAKYGVTVDQLMQWNQLSGSTIYVGQQLVVNGQQTSATAASQQAAATTADNSQSTQAAAADNTAAQATVAQSTDASQQAASSQQAAADTTAQQSATTADTDAQASTQVAAQAQPAVQTQQQAATPSTTDNSASSQAQVTQTAQQTNTASSNDLQSGSVVSLATKLASTNSIPYVWGGSSLSGMDCSGLVDYVYANAEGKSLPHNTVALEGVVTKKAVSDAQAGDLLFWGDQGASYHVAIYIGNNQYVAAATPGTNVSVYTISPYFAPSFAGSVN